MRPAFGKTALVLLIVLALTGFAGLPGAVAREQTPDGVTVVSLTHALPLSQVMEAVTREHSWEQARVSEVYHCFAGEHFTFVGSFHPAIGMTAPAFTESYNEFYEAMLSDVQKQTSQVPSLSADLAMRSEMFQAEGIQVYGLVLNAAPELVSILSEDLPISSIDRARAREGALEPTCPYGMPELQIPCQPTEPQVTFGSQASFVPHSGFVSTYSDTDGWRVFYNQMAWTAESIQRFSTGGQGYEHDVVLNNYDGQRWAGGLRGTWRGTGWDSNLPWAYLDYATVDDNPDEPVYTVGTFNAKQLTPGTVYYSWLRAYPGNAQADTAKLYGQKMNVYGYSVWLVFAETHEWIVPPWNISVPGTHYWQ